MVGLVQRASFAVVLSARCVVMQKHLCPPVSFICVPMLLFAVISSCSHVHGDVTNIHASAHKLAQQTSMTAQRSRCR